MWIADPIRQWHPLAIPFHNFFSQSQWLSGNVPFCAGDDSIMAA
jgi:hypothetical protein